MNEDDIFSSEMAKCALKQLSKEDLLKYKKMGKELYNSIDFTNSEILNNIEEPTHNAIVYLTEQIMSGLHPSDLEENDKIILSDRFGEKWYTKFGYKEQDLTSFSTYQDSITFDQNA